MRRLAISLLLLPGLASAIDFGKLALEKGYQGPLVVDVKWGDGTARPVSTATATLTVYSTPPKAGQGGVVLLAKTMLPVGSTAPSRLTCDLASSETAVPGFYYAELALVDGVTRDTSHGTVIIEGL